MARTLEVAAIVGLKMY
ncbi:MAG: hypothetical protein ACLR3X_03135 [Intestinibacter bartlettii]